MQVAEILMMVPVVTAMIGVIMVVVVTMIMRVIVCMTLRLQPGAFVLAASAYRAHGATSESVNESPAVARRTPGVPGNRQ
jgi:hypothetical protein